MCSLHLNKEYQDVDVEVDTVVEDEKKEGECMAGRQIAI